MFTCFLATIIEVVTIPARQWIGSIRMPSVGDSIVHEDFLHRGVAESHPLCPQRNTGLPMIEKPLLQANRHDDPIGRCPDN